MWLVLASNNQGKLDELRRLLPEWVEVTTASELQVELPEETGTTFAENAFLKARSVVASTGQIAIADDSGLEVDALNGAPGVRSARFAGEPSDDQLNNALLLEKLAGIAPSDRTARFRSVVAVVTPGGETFRAEGVLEGRIRDTPLGSGGFGYDPLFVPAGSTKTLAELSLDQKNQISHRAIAFHGILKELLNLLDRDQSWNSAGIDDPAHTSR